MAQTFFIDLDEEIISVISRLRKSSDTENYFVFPKRSLVLQSAVNLRLFQREAEKQGKRIIIVSQDESGRKLAERVGIPTKEYSADVGNIRQEEGVSLAPSGAVERTTAPVTPIMPSENHIGSSRFSQQGKEHALSVESRTAPARPLSSSVDGAPQQGVGQHRLRVRDMSTRHQTALNSKSDVQVPPVSYAPSRAPVGPIPKDAPSQERAPQEFQQPREYVAAPMPVAGQNERLQRFFAHDQTEERVQSQSGYAPVAKTTSLQESKEDRGVSFQKSSPTGSNTASSWKGWLYGVLGIAVMGGIGGAIYFLVPKATIVVTPHELTHAVEGKYEGRVIAPIGDQNDTVVPVRTIEKTYTSTVSMEATGTASSGNQKARGTLVISNEYSSDPQPLIATTRFETPDGKIFRLAESVTVPGMTLVDGKREPGVVEAVVLADASGGEYNVAPTTFTIPGFKGSPKYSAFHAASTKSFSGGGESDSGTTSITKEDTEKALQKLKEQSQQDFHSMVERELMPDERIIDDSLEITDTGKSTLPLIGSIGAHFDVDGSYSGRVFVVSEKILKEALAQRGIPEEKGVKFSVTDATITFQSVVPNYDTGSVEFGVTADLMLTSVIDTDALRSELLGQNETGIKAVLERHPELKKIEVNFSPEFLFQRIPTNEKRVFIQVVSERS